MAEFESPYCPECDDAYDFPQPPPLERRPAAVGRRDFLGAAVAAVAAGTLAGRAAAVGPPRKPRPAEELIKELFSGLSAAQKQKTARPYDDRDPKTKALKRLGMFNAPIEAVRIEDAYTKAQTELIERIVKSMSSGEGGYRQISRLGRWDDSGSLPRCGAMIFGDPCAGTKDEPSKWAFVFAGHHLTIRCDGDSEEGTAFGGPIYYGHLPNGYSRGNVFNYQTRSVLKVYKALDGKQRDKAVVKLGNPGEGANSVRFKKRADDRPGIRAEDLSRDQRALVEQVMRDILSPFRKEDVDEVMGIVKKNGGMDKIQLAFYPDKDMKDDEPWHFWRLEGPGFVWNYRPLPHVHTFVNISSKVG